MIAAVAQPLGRIMLVAGEPSGDALGAKLMAALKLRSMGLVEFVGVGGALMEAQGLKSLFPIDELSVMGLLEVLPRAPQLLARLRETAQAVDRLRPAAVVTIDSPGFNFRLAKRIRGLGIPLIHYVAPQVWAWRPKRAKKVAKLFDHLLALLPFEPSWFEGEGLPTTFVGHPAIEVGVIKPDGKTFRRQLGIGPDALMLLLLPGSRADEVRRHLPVFAETVRLLRLRFPDLAIVLPAVPAVAENIASVAASWPDKPLVVQISDRAAAFAAANAALAASGTVTLELALAGVATVIAYRMHPITSWLARRLVTIPYAGLANILMEREVMPELLLEQCRPERLAEALGKALTDHDARDRHLREAALIAEKLGAGGEPPSLKAADAVLRAIAIGPHKGGPRKARGDHPANPNRLTQAR
jgi:lipid-A-disaccharide synthase